MSLVSDLIKEVVDSSSDLSQVLRKAQVLGSELRSEELKVWSGAELDGYGNDDELPDYRVSVGSNFGNFVGMFGTQANGMPIPLGNLPKGYQGKTNLELRQGVAALDAMFKSEADHQQVWKADAIAAVAGKIYTDMNMISAWMPISKATIAGVLDSVRHRLLNFLLKLKEQHPEVELAGIDFRSIPSEDVRMNVVNNIYGGSNVFASGQAVHQQVRMGVSPGDLESLLSALRASEVPAALVDELASAIEEDSSADAGGLGPKVSGWLARVGERVANNSITALATQALLRYYGIAAD